MDQKLAAHLCLSYCDGVGPMRYKKLKSILGSVEKIFNEASKTFESILGIETGRKIYAFVNRFDYEKEDRYLTKNYIAVLTQEDSRYPRSLLRTSDPPICLFVKGDLAKNDFNIHRRFAVVGTRNISSYGIYTTKLFARALAQNDITVVSGMALGVDSVAHSASMEFGKTIAVLGCGVDIVYPPSNRRLYNQIVEGGGLVVSEFPPRHTVLKGLFVARNRIISGLSEGVLVIEGAEDSGSLITARFAAEQGRDVFAVPSPITSSVGFAPNFLIREGARLATSPEDILQEFGIEKRKAVKAMVFSSKDEADLFDILLRSPLSVDELVEKTARPITHILGILTALELRGYIEKNESGDYAPT